MGVVVVVVVIVVVVTVVVTARCSHKGILYEIVEAGTCHVVPYCFIASL